MSFWMTILVFGILIKLSKDDLDHQSVHERDLIVLIVACFCLFEPGSNPDWLLKMFVLGMFAWAVSKKRMGSGDLIVLSALGLVLSLEELLLMIRLAALIAGLVVLHKKKAAETLPFVPYLSMGALVVYLIRLRLIFS